MTWVAGVRCLAQGVSTFPTAAAFMQVLSLMPLQLLHRAAIMLNMPVMFVIALHVMCDV
jgi:hypothetical protein